MYKRGTEFSTNPEGMSTVNPKHAVFESIMNHRVSHHVNLHKLLIDANEAEEAKLAATSHPIDEATTKLIMGRRVSQIARTGKLHEQQEDTLIEVKRRLIELKKEVDQVHVDECSPYSDKTKLLKGLTPLLNESRRLETHKKKVKDALNKSNNKLPRDYQQNPHVPVADETS